MDDQRRGIEVSSFQLAHALLGRSLAYSSGALAYKALALVTLPVLARLLSPTELGILDIGSLIAGVVGLVAGFGLDNSLTRYHGDSQIGTRVWAVAIVAVGAAAGCFIVTGILFGSQLARILVGRADMAIFVPAASAYGASIALAMIGLTAMRLRATAIRFAVASFAFVFAETAGALLIAATINNPVPIILLWWTTVSSVGALALFFTYLRRLVQPTLEAAFTLARFGLPLVMATASWIVGDMVLRSLVAHDSGLAAVGQYGIASRVVSSVSVVIAGFSYAWQSDLYATPTGMVAGLLRQRLPAILAALALAAVVLAIAARELVAVIAGPSYQGGSVFVMALAAATSAFGVFTYLTAAAGYHHATRLSGFAAGTGLICQILIGLVLVPSLGGVGAALASAAGYYLAVIVLMHRLRWMGMTLGQGSLAALALTVAVCAPLALMPVHDESLLIRIGVGLVAIGVTFAFLWVAHASLKPRGVQAG